MAGGRGGGGQVGPHLEQAPPAMWRWHAGRDGDSRFRWTPDMAEAGELTAHSRHRNHAIVISRSSITPPYSLLHENVTCTFRIPS